MKIKRQAFFLLGYILFLLILLFFWSPREKEPVPNEQIMFRLAETYPREHPSAQAAERFAQLVYERTNGRILINVYYNGELGSESEVLEQMQFGGIALARVNFLRLSDTVSVLQQHVTPFAYESLDEQLRWLSENYSDFALKLQLEKLVPLVCYYPDLRCFYTNKKTILSADDFAGLKFKLESAGILRTIFLHLNAEPVEVMSNNIFKSLSSGFVDSGETSLCSFILSDYYSVAPYVTVSNYIYAPDVLVASIPSISGLSKDDQQLLAQCAQDTFAFQKKTLFAMQEQSLQTLWERSGAPATYPELEETLRERLATESGGGER